MTVKDVSDMTTNYCLVLLTVIVICRHAQVVTSKREHGLYLPTDNVTILTNDNFYEHFVDKENAWVIEFYNSWCGHCINFAPTWKKFGSYTNGWDRVLSVGAMDCSSPNNSALCRTFDTRGYPTMMYFKPHASKNESHHSAAETLAGGQSFDTLVRVTHRFLESISNSTPASWPKLQPLRRIEEIWTEATERHEHVFLIFEAQRSVLGKEVILDTMNEASILVRRMLSEEVAKFGISVFPSLYSLNKEGIYKRIMFGQNNKQDRTDFVLAIRQFSGMSALKNLPYKKTDVPVEKSSESHVKEELKKTVETMQNNNTLLDVVHMKDLVSTLHYSLKQEVAIKNSMDEEVLKSLNNFIIVLTKYFPGTKEVQQFLRKVKEWLYGITAPLTGETWARELDILQDERSFLPDEQQWIHCAGSELRYRGYPCGMWTLFHTLTVSSYLSHFRTNPQEVLLAIRGYMKHFFGCEECSQNFYKMASSIEESVHKKEDTVLWLWKAHNKANKRLHGDLSEDPEHPKIQFPSHSLCPKCRIGSGETDSWDEKEVLKFLVELYRPENIAQFHQDTQLVTEKQPLRRDGELDWWERKQREQDLMKVKELKQLKKVAREQKVEREVGQQVVQQGYEMKAGQYQVPRRGWGLNGVDLGMCMMFYVMCAVIILLMYYHFTIRRNWKPFGCLPI